VPRHIPDADGNPGERNALRVVSLEHKLGLHGSPTCVMEYAGATGWLVGAENGGMAAMFTMMNNARLGVGVQGVGVAEGAFQHALAYAQGRVQGKAPGTGTIVEHADVRRMLAAMKADTQAARAIALSCAVAIDMAEATGDAAWTARAALLTPIAKSFGTDVGIWVANEGVQIHGGMGYVEETGAAQFLRDVRVTAIYEGTNGIQAMDLVGRKMMDGGDAAFRLLDEVQDGAEAARAAEPDLAQAVWNAAESLRETTEWLVEQGMDRASPGRCPTSAPSPACSAAMSTCAPRSRAMPRGWRSRGSMCGAFCPNIPAFSRRCATGRRRCWRCRPTTSPRDGQPAPRIATPSRRRPDRARRWRSPTASSGSACRCP
jgi:acyl-CoA dehydrogenase